MEDYKNIRMSQEASDIVDRIRQKYGFSEKGKVMQFAMAYALKEYRDEMDYLALDALYPKDGINESLGTIEDGQIVKTVIQSLYPDCDVPYRYARAAIIYGLLKIRDKIDSDPSFNIAVLMD